MPEVRVQDEQGNIHVFPDGSTPDMIAKAMNVKPPAAEQPEGNTIGAAPTGALPFLRNLESDIRYGSNSTGIGRFLHMIGMQPTTAGAGAADETLASPITGPLHIAEGVAQTPSHPGQGLKQAGLGVLESASIPLAFAGPETKELGPVIERAAARAGEVGDAAAQAGRSVNNAAAKVLRYPATARQAQMGKPGTIKNFLPPQLQKWAIPDFLVPKGELGSVTRPGPYAEIPTKIKPPSLSSIAERDATRLNVPFAGEDIPEAVSGEVDRMPRPLRPTVGTPEEFQVYDNQMSRLKQEASDAGTYSAARGKVGKKLNYQQRIQKATQ